MGLFVHPEHQPTSEDQEAFDGWLAMRRRYDMTSGDRSVQGTLLDLSWRGNMFLRILLRPADGIRIPSKHPVFDFIDDKSPNAHAGLSPDGGTFFIGFTVGLMSRLYGAAYAYMCMPELFADVGIPPNKAIPDRELSECVFPPSGLPCWLAARAQDYPLPSVVFARFVPADIDRLYFAHGMVGILLQWLFYHEFYHLWAGHFELRQRWKGAQARRTEESSNNAVADSRIAQLIEIDADKRASRRLVQEITSELGILLNALKKGEMTIDQQMRAFALMLVTLFELLNPSSAYQPSNSHPHCDVRFWSAYQAFKDLLDSSTAAIFDQHIRASHSLVQRLRKVSPSPRDSYELSRTDIECVIGESNRLNSEVISELYPLTKPYDVDQRDGVG